MVAHEVPEATERFAELFGRLTANVARVIRGKDHEIGLVMLCLLAEGHLLLQDVPGVGKTSLAKALARSLDCPFGRIQFTPDLLPTDVIGVTVWDRSAGRFDFRRGPLFASVVLADEINRASPKTQSALLEAMAERQVTVDGVTYPLAPPFMVLATQNPIEHEGTYPLPESQLDRFLMRVSLGYPERRAELEILDRPSDTDHLDELTPVLSRDDLSAMTAIAGAVHVAPGVRDYLVDLADASRRHGYLALGMSPRATLNLQAAARARAAAESRHFVTPDDLKALAVPVLAHRVLLTPDAQLQDVTPEAAVEDLLERVPVPSPKPP